MNSLAPNLILLIGDQDISCKIALRWISGPYSWLVDIGSGNVLVPLVITWSSVDPVVAIYSCCHMATLVTKQLVSPILDVSLTYLFIYVNSLASLKNVAAILKM